MVIRPIQRWALPGKASWLARRRRPGAAAPEIWPTTAERFAEMSQFSGNLTSMYLYTAGDGENELDLIGTNHASPSGTFVTRGELDAGLGTLAASAANNVDANLTAGDFLDSDASTSVAAVFTARFLSAPTAGQQHQAFGKYNGSGSGWALRVRPTGLFVFMTDGDLSFAVADSANFFDGRVVHGLLKINRTTDRAQLFTTVIDGEEIDISAKGSYGNAAGFSIFGGGGNSPAQVMGFLALLSGADAEAITMTHVDNFLAAQQAAGAPF